MASAGRRKEKGTLAEGTACAKAQRSGCDDRSSWNLERVSMTGVDKAELENRLEMEGERQGLGLDIRTKAVATKRGHEYIRRKVSLRCLPGSGGCRGKCLSSTHSRIK